MRVVAIINPMSGAGLDPSIAAARVATIGGELKRRGIDPNIVVTERAGHARPLQQGLPEQDPPHGGPVQDREDRLDGEDRVDGA